MRQGGGVAKVLVTGSSTGLGLIAARRLVGWGHDVTLHARDAGRAAEPRAALPGAAVVLGDLSGVAGTRDVAEQVTALGRHDAVVHNAGVYRVPHRVETADGLSLTFAVNVLAPYLLTALLPRPDRLVFLTSGLHDGGNPTLDDAQWTRRRWDWFQAYSDSKLFDTTLAFAVARLWPGVRSNAVNPGWVPTRMGGPGAPDDLDLGADTQAWLAAGDDPATDLTATYLHHRRAEQAPRAAHDVAAQDALLAYCAELTGEKLTPQPPER
jgi:NAD(P)-dependent dehydrogenase (short-subunit alcohol dehydrogenase family)